MDVYLTKDGHVVAIHDSTTGRTCNENLAVESSTLEQLKRLYANKYYEEDPVYGQCRIPTLEEYLEWFKGKDCLFFIEIKSENDCEKVVYLPDGNVCSVTDRHAVLTCKL